MNPSALKAALQELLAKGESAKDSDMQKMASMKKGHQPTPDVCPECKVALVDGGKCPKCGYVKDIEGQKESDSEDSGEGLAGILEQAGR